MSHSRILIEDANVFDGITFSVRDVLIDEGKIQTEFSSARNATVVNGRGKYLVPAFIDCHIHLSDQEDGLSELATWGVGTAMDMACFPPPVWKSFPRRPGSCDFRTAGAPATCSGSKHAKTFGPRLEPYLIRWPDDAPEWVQKRVDEGSDYIKIVADAPVGPDEDTLDALVASARWAGKKTVIHAANKKAFEMAAYSHADFVTHVPTDEQVSEDTITLMHNANIVSIPSLSVEEKRSKLFNLNYTAARETVRLLHESGVTILAGTDSSGSSGSVPLPYGSTLHHEFELLCEAGLTPLEVLRSTTVLAAQNFGLDDRGMIEDGKRADLVLLKNNPLDNIRNTRSIEAVWCAGVQVAR